MLPISSSRIGWSLVRCASLLALIAVLLTVCSIGTPIHAQRDTRVRPERAQVDWPAAARDAQALSPDLAAPAASKVFSARHTRQVGELLKGYAVKEGMVPLAHLSRLAAKRYPGVANVPIPVLAPLEPEQLFAAKTRTSRPQPTQSLLVKSIERMQFLPGATGYDALLTVSSGLLRELGITTTPAPQLHIAGTSLIYGSGEDGEIVADLQGPYPGLRRLPGDDEVTYTFRKYGVPYFINVACSHSPRGAKSLACTQADAIVRAVLRDLRLLGGGPVAIKPKPRAAAAVTVPHPTNISPDFKYFPPGSLLRGTSEGNQGGSPDRGTYGPDDLRFPIKDAPAYANSQVFMHWGNCRGQEKDLGGGLYECKQNPGKQLQRLEGHKENYSDPWRDNFCESRGEIPAKGAEPDCPLKKGHSGQDIRPSGCPRHPKTKNRCGIDVYEVVAVAKGAALWKTGDHENNVKFVADTDGNNKLYYVYLHMSPKALKGAGLKRGEWVKKKGGEKVGLVGNFDHATADDTSQHLHFEVRRGDNIGKPLNPYMTLIRAYERLIKALGTEITD